MLKIANALADAIALVRESAAAVHDADLPDLQNLHDCCVQLQDVLALAYSGGKAA